MKRKLLFIFALLCAVAQGAWAQRVVDLSTISSEYEAQDGDVLTGETRERLYIVDGATVTFSNLTVLPEDDDYGVVCRGDACIILAEKTMNTVKANITAISMSYNPEKTLTIKGTGSLHAESLREGAGIGCDPGAIIHSKSTFESGNLVIESGNITAIGCCEFDVFNGYLSGPGIGSVFSDDIYITINGGNITATGGSYSAGIGSCFSDIKTQHGGNITINGGTIVAKGGEEAAGIGGAEGNTGGNIFIYGGDITATGGDYAAGIGGGDGATGGAIWITGGTVKAYGGKVTE